MGIYTDQTTILGIRILVEEPINSGDYYVKHEFTGSNWKKDEMRVVSYYFALKDVKIQTLHPFSTSYNITTGQKKEPANLWLDNIYIKVEDLLT